MTSQYFIKVSPKGKQRKLIELIGCLTDSPRSRNTSNLRFSKSKKILKTVVTRSPTIKLEKHEEMPTIKKEIREEELQKDIHQFPYTIQSSENLVKRIQKDHDEYDPKSFKVRLVDMITRKRFNVDLDHINIIKAFESVGECDQKYLLKCYRNTERKKIENRSNTLPEATKLIDSSKMGMEMRKKIVSITAERDKIEKELKHSIQREQRKKSFFNAIKLRDPEIVKNELERDATLVHELYAMKQTPLHLACKKNYSEIVLILLEYGADPMAKDLVGRNSVDICKQNDSRDSLSILYRNSMVISKLNSVSNE